MHRYASLASLLPLVAAHGFLSSPPGRRPGDAYRATCGAQPFYQQSSDINGNVQGIQQVVGNDATEDCNLWLCKGFLFEDNQDQVQTYSLGQTIDITVNIAAPHTGYANVSVVKTSTNTMIGNPLIEFQNYASNAGMAANNTAFSVTLPETLGGDCTTPGDCVLQWFWDAPDIDQTYEACADFVVAAGSGTSPSAAPASSVSATSAAAVTTTSTVSATSVDPAPAETTTAVPGNPGDDECPADDGGEDEEEEDGEGEGDGNGDVECPADGGEEEGEEEGEDIPEDECPAEDGEGDDQAATTTTTSLGVKDVSTSAAATATGNTSTVTQVVTSTVTTERVVTVTAAATACN